MNRRALLTLLILVVAAVVVLYMVNGRGKSAAAPRSTPAPGHHVAVPADLHHAEVYADQLLPIADRTVGVFSSVTAKAQRAGNLGRLASVCSAAVPQLSVLQSRADGVPHPYPWYSRVGALHRWLLGLYHDMVGAAVACQTEAGNGDGGDAHTSVGQMARTTQQFRQLDSHLHDLVKRLNASR